MNSKCKMSDYSSVGPPQAQNINASAAFAAALQRAKQVSSPAKWVQWPDLFVGMVVGIVLRSRYAVGQIFCFFFFRRTSSIISNSTTTNKCNTCENDDGAREKYKIIVLNVFVVFCVGVRLVRVQYRNLFVDIMIIISQTIDK